MSTLRIRGLQVLVDRGVSKNKSVLPYWCSTVDLVVSLGERVEWVQLRAVAADFQAAAGLLHLQAVVFQQHSYSVFSLVA